MDEATERIIMGCQKGDAKSQERLYMAYYRYAMSIALRFSASMEDAREIVNDSFVKVFKKIQLFDGQKEFRPWLRRIVVNSSIDRYRADLKECGDACSLDLAASYTDNLSCLDDLNAQDIISLINRLPENYRIPFVLYELEGYSHAEIAVSLNIKESTSRSNLTRAKQQLQQLLQNQYSYERH